MTQEILIQNNFIQIPAKEVSLFQKSQYNPENVREVATVLSNMAYYGYAPSVEVFSALQSLDKTELSNFWTQTRAVMEKVTGADRKMDNFVVYKNFPKEVMAMDQAEYWMRQMFVYLGFQEDMAEEKQERTELKELHALKVLALANEDTLSQIFDNLVTNKSRWSDVQKDSALTLATFLNVNEVNIDDFGFKENAIVFAKHLRSFNSQAKVEISTATDVLRLAAAMSDGDVSLRQPTPFRKFTRAERRFLLEKLEGAKNLTDDLGLRQEQFKKFIRFLHPADYNMPAVSAAYKQLCAGELRTFNSKTESLIQTSNPEVLARLITRPGDFVRRFHKLYSIFGEKTLTTLEQLAPELETQQLLKLSKYVQTINERKTLLYPPRGNWARVQLVQKNKVNFANKDVERIKNVVQRVVGERLDSLFPEGVALDASASKVKLQTNDQKLANYGRGTEFDIPKQMNFLRTSSYWSTTGLGTTWYDNGWNFFDNNWQACGTICWNHTHDVSGSVFSGDPVNTQDLQGRACQMIDLDLQKLQEQGVRYAVWSILSYNSVPFSDANDVLGTLQWGEHAQEGNLFEPARAQMVFPVRSEGLSKYVAYVDVKERKLFYMDANLPANVRSAGSNAHSLQEKMPAFVEYLKSLPSVSDLFECATLGQMPVMYSDKDVKIDAQRAYVFKPENTENVFEKVEIVNALEKPASTKKLKLR